jgi:hypothetical protein
MIYSWLLTVTTKYNIEKGPIFDTLLILILAQVFTVRAPHGTSTVTAVRGLSPNARHNEARQASFVTTTSTPSIAMTAYKHPIAHHWIKQTLVPFLLFAFASMLPYPADILAEIQHSIDFALVKPDHLSDGDDMIFERIFMALMHRNQDLAPDLTMVVDNLESCAKYLIRRAQVKGPFKLLERTDVGRSAWMESERQRLNNLTAERKEAGNGMSIPFRWMDCRVTMRRVSTASATTRGCTQNASH